MGTLCFVTSWMGGYGTNWYSVPPGGEVTRLFGYGVLPQPGAPPNPAAPHFTTAHTTQPQGRTPGAPPTPLRSTPPHPTPFRASLHPAPPRLRDDLLGRRSEKIRVSWPTDHLGRWSVAAGCWPLGEEARQIDLFGVLRADLLGKRSEV